MRSTQDRLLHRLGPLLTPRGFYLAGGTAIALYLGHRRSVDLDWFSEGPLEDPERLALDLQADSLQIVTQRVSRGTLHAVVLGVQTSFIEFPYPLLESPAPMAEYGCQLASLDDLATMKLSALLQRGAKKAFVDLYALGREHKPLPNLLELYQRRFSIQNIGQVVFALNYFDDADRERLPPMLWEVGWREIKRTIQGWVRELDRSGPSL